MVSTTQPTAFADLLQRYRRAAGMTQEELAERACLSVRGISNLERGVRRLPRRHTVALLAEAMRLPAAERSALEAAARGPGMPAVSAAPTGVALSAQGGVASPTLVGRAQEMALLGRHLRGEGPPVLLLAGEPGIGKSRLLQEAREQAANQGWKVLRGGCQRLGGQEPYAPVLEALERSLRAQPLAQLRTALQGCAWLVRLLPELAAGPIEPLPNWTVSAEQERRLMFGAVARFLANVAGPTGSLLVLDDLQWAGADALDLLATLVRAETPLRMIGAYRDTEVGPDHPLAVLLADLAHAGLATQRSLGPLASHEVRHLLSQFLERGVEGQEMLRERVLQRAGGVPFFVVSCAQGLREAALAGSVATVVPWDLAQSLRQRVATLPEPAREILGAASVIGRLVPATLLTAVAGRPEWEVLVALDAACRARLLVEEGLAYRFTHDVIREVVEADVGATRRMALHRRVVQALEDAEAGRRDGMVEQLAYHSRQAGEARQAVRYARLAGDRAVRMSAYREAVAQFGVALELLGADDVRTRAELLDELGAAAYPLSDTGLYLRYWEEAQRLYEQTAERRKAADLSRRLGRVYWERGETTAAFAHTRAAVAALEEEPPGPELAMAYSALSQLYMCSSRYQESVAWGEKALHLAEQLGEVAVEVHALNNIGTSLTELRQAERGIAQLERSLARAKGAGLAFDTIRAYDNLSQRLLSLGEFGRVADLVREGLIFTDQAGWVMGTGFLLNHLATVQMEWGYWDQAHDSIDRAIRAGEIGLPIGRLMAVPKRGELLLRQGRLHEALPLLEAVLPASRAQGEFEVIGQLLPTLARLYLALGDHVHALSAMDACVALWRDLGPLVESESMLGYGVEVYLQAGREDIARELLASLSTLTGQVGTVLGWARLADARGMIAAHEGRHEEAATHFLRAAGNWHEMACPYQEAWARRHRAESLLRAGDPTVRAEADNELGVARAIFRRLGAPEIPGDEVVVAPAELTREPTVAVPTNLPLALTSFVGRERELATVRRLLGETRLLTLTGAGGCGKTRLALEVGRLLVRQAPQAAAYADGIWLVELAPLGDGALVGPTVATVLGVRERPGQSLLDTLTTYLCPKQVLLLLDNCEHLVAACAVLVDALLRVCPGLTVLATSREALGIGGELPWRVPSLRLPDPRGPLIVEQALTCEAVQLFVRRARVVRPGFAPTGEQVAQMARICVRLDGIPLALELAAARLSVLSLDQLSTRLDDRFRLLTGGNRAALPRQQTLRATLDWSYDLLGEPERLLLRRLSVFANGWTLEAVEAVCAGEGIAPEEILDRLAGLVAKSLVLLEEGRTGARYRLLETVRQYGREKLIATGEAPRLMDCHLGWYLTLAGRAALGMGGMERELWLERMEIELENLRSALNWSSLAGSRQEAGLRLAAALEDFWYLRGYASEGRRWLGDLLQWDGAASTVLRARALDVLALLTHYQGEEAQALALFEAAHALHSGDGDERGVSWSLSHQALVAIYLGDYARATPLLEQALPMHRAHGDQHGVGWTLNYLAQIQQLQGHHAQAAALYGESLAVFQKLGDKFGLSDQFAHLANVARELGNHARAKRLHREGLRVLRALMDRPGLAKCFEGLAMLAAGEGSQARAARLLGTAHCLRETIGTPVEAVDRTARDRTVADVRAALGEEAFAAAWTAGQAIALEEAIAHALQEAAHDHV